MGIVRELRRRAPGRRVVPRAATVRASLLAVVATIACSTGSDHPLPSGPPPADTTQPVLALVEVAGDSQVGTVGAALPTPLEVAVRDTAGRGVAGVRVQFAVVGTNARLTPVSGTVRTGSDGHAKVIVTLGRRAEAVRVVAAGAEAFGAAAFDLVATPSPALTVVPISGDSQVVALPGSRLDAFAVVVRDTFGNTVGARTVTFRVTGGSASFDGQSAVTVTSDPAGVASAALTTPAPAEGDTVRATATTPGAVTPPLQLLATGLAFRGRRWESGVYHVCAIAAAGPAYCWGSGGSGQLGNGGTANQSAPAPVVGGAGLLAVSAGSSASCGLGADGTAVCWGSSSSGGANAGATPYRSISVGNGSACGVSGTGTVYCWGSSRLAISSPVRFVEVSAGAGATCGLTGDGKAWCWGSNSSGAVGAGDWTVAYTAPANVTPRPVSGGLTFRSLSAGYIHVCGLTTSGAAYCWGSNSQGQLLVGNSTNANAPVPVGGGLAFADISAGAQHTCAVTTAGAAYCWGYNHSGELGDGTTSYTPLTTPTPVTGGLTFVSVSAGEYATCGIAAGGAAYCWGSNSSGQLGVGTVAYDVMPTPTPVTGGLLFQPAPPALAGHRGPPQR